MIFDDDGIPPPSPWTERRQKSLDWIGISLWFKHLQGQLNIFGPKSFNFQRKRTIRACFAKL